MLHACIRISSVPDLTRTGSEEGSLKSVGFGGREGGSPREQSLSSRALPPRTARAPFSKVSPGPVGLANLQ